MAEVPLELPTGRVVGKFIFEVQDNSDPGEEPQLVPVTGDIIIKSSIDNLSIFDQSLGKFITFRGPHKAIINSLGELATPDPIYGEPMYTGMSLWSNDSDKLSVKGWTYTATFNLKTVEGKNLDLQPATFTLATGQELDLADVIRVPATPGYGLPQAEGAALRAESAAVSAGEDAAEALAAAVRAEAVAGVTDAGIASLVSDGSQTGAAIDARINTQATPVVEQITADYIASDQSVIDAAAAAVDANPKILEIEGRELPDRGSATIAKFPSGAASIAVKGSYSIWSAGEATNLGLPLSAAGDLDVFTFGQVIHQRFVAKPSGGTFEFHNWKMSNASPWTGWAQGRNTEYESRLSALETPAPGTGTTKIAAVALSTGDGGGTDSATNRSFRYPLKIAATGQRVRVHIQNTNPRYGNRVAGALSFAGLGIGRHAGETDASKEGQFSGPITPFATGFSTNAVGWEYVSPWLTGDPVKGYTEYLISGGYTCAAQNNFAGVGGGWITDEATDWNVAAPAGLTLSQSLPLFVWLEIEVDSKVPVGAWFGDSLASGVSARLGVFDSIANKHALAHGYIPTLYANSGTKMGDHLDPAGFKWTRYDTATGLAKPDMLFWQMGSNDVFGTGVTVAEMRTRFDACWQIAASKLSSNICLMTILPRLDAASPQEPVRKAWNEVLLAELPGRATAAVDSAALLTSPDGSTLNPLYRASPTNIHLTAAGYVRNMQGLPAMSK